MRTTKNHRVELASGVDALYLSSHPNIPQSLFQSLLNQRNALGNANLESEPFVLGGEVFDLSARSWGKYPVSLNHRHALIGFSSSQALPSVRVQFRAEYLHSTDLGEAISWITLLLHAEGIEVDWKVSRLDLFIDIQGWEIDQSDRDLFQCRAKSFHAYSEGSQVSGFNFGRRKSNTILARVYNKSMQMKSENKQWTHLIWSKKFDPNQTVWRIEFEFNSQYFRECHLDSLEEVINHIGSIWKNATLWLTHRYPSEDSNKSRWPISEEWKMVQGASLAAHAVPLERISENKKRSSLEGLMSGLMGYVTSVAAYSNGLDLDSKLNFVIRKLIQHSKETKRPLEEIIYLKAQKVNQL